MNVPTTYAPSTRGGARGLGVVRVWILLNTVLVAGGWALSAVHGLTWAGYAALALLFAVLVWRFAEFSWSGRWVPPRRFRRRLPLLFLMLLVLTCLGGALWRPEFADGLAYRTPRVLHWLHEHAWEWIHTPDARKNNRGVGYEWVTAPLLLFSHTDRLLFLINLSSLTLLPGLIFAFLRTEWVRPRTAWSWSWVLAGATGFVLQGGSMAADLHAVPFYLAAIVFARRAAESGRWSDLSFSTLGIALASGVKPFNVVFFLPWLISIYPALHVVFRRRAWHLAWLVPVAALSSFVPLAIINLQHTGNWTGLTPARPGQPTEYAPVSPTVGLIGNAWLITSQNVLPPVMPRPAALAALQTRLAATPTGQKFQVSFEHLFFTLREQETESTAGLGLAVVLLLIFSAFGAGRVKTMAPRAAPPASVWLADASIWLGLLAFMMKAGAYEAGRLALPFYIPLLPPLLRRAGWSELVRQRWWRCGAMAALLYTAGILLFSRGRPLLPWETVFSTLQRVQPASATWPRALAAVQAHHRRADLFAGVRTAIPAEEKSIGLVAGVVRAATLWLPYGSRFVYDVTADDTPAELLRHGIRYVVLPAAGSVHFTGESEVQRAKLEAAGDVVARVAIEGTLSQPGEEWLVLRLRP